jgi:hypothetical protein
MGLPQRSAACDPLIGPVASLDADFDRIRAELVAGPLSDKSIAAQLEQWSKQVAPFVAEYAKGHPETPTVEQWQASVAALQLALHNSLSTTGR